MQEVRFTFTGHHMLCLCNTMVSVLLVPGMRDSDTEEGDTNYSALRREGTDYVQDPHRNRPPRVKSAKHGGEEMNSAIQSIKDLRQSLASSAVNSNLTPTAGYSLFCMSTCQLNWCLITCKILILQWNVDNKTTFGLQKIGLNSRMVSLWSWIRLGNQSVNVCSY